MTLPFSNFYETWDMSVYFNKTSNYEIFVTFISCHYELEQADRTDREAPYVGSYPALCLHSVGVVN